MRIETTFGLDLKQTKKPTASFKINTDTEDQGSKRIETPDR